MPDSGRTRRRFSTCFASCVVRSKECQAGSVLISGGIQASLLYLAGGETTPRLLETYLPFSIKKEISGCEASDLAQLQCRVTHADGRVLNSRKLLVRVEIGCDLHLYRPAAETIYVPDASDPICSCTAANTRCCWTWRQGKLFAMEEEPGCPPGGRTRSASCSPGPAQRDGDAPGRQPHGLQGVSSACRSFMKRRRAGDPMGLPAAFSQFIDLAGSYEEGPPPCSSSWPDAR